MRNASKITALMMFLVSTYGSLAQTLSNRGKEFWVGYGHHQFMEHQTLGGPKNSQEMVLYFSAQEQPAQVRVTVNGSTYSESYAVPANSVVQSRPIPKGSSSPVFHDFRLYTLPQSFGGTNSEGLFTKHGIHIESDVPIVVYTHVYGSQSSGSAMLMPVETWGYAYVSLNTRQLFNTNGARDCFSWVYVVAKENNTRVRIVPTANTRGGQLANVPFEVDLQKGEIYQILGELLSDDEGYDLTGSKITSIANDQGTCFPIAVFSGSSRTVVTCTDDKNGGDYFIQQLFPYQAWGKHFLTAPTSIETSPKTNNINVFRIVVKDPNTIVKKNGMRLLGIRGFYYEYQSDQADYIEADQPIQVAQYMPSAGDCFTVGNGDPELILISPVEQGINQTGFFRNTKEKIVVNYLTLIIPTAGLGSLKIDGALNNYSHSYPHPNLPGYTVVIKRWNAEQKQCIVQSDSAFTGITYGIGEAETYGYNIGTLVKNLNGMPFIRNKYSPVTTANSFTCVNTPVQLSVLLQYQPVRLQWKLSQLKDTITPSFDVDVPPVLTGTETINGTQYYKYTLPQSYRFRSAGIFTIPVLATHASIENCNNTEEIPYVVEVKKGLRTDFDIIFNDCKPEELIRFNGRQSFLDSTPIYSWNWTLANATDTSKLSGKNIQQELAAGSYTASLMAVSNEGCVADTTKPFRLHNKPLLPLFNAQTISCQGDTVTFTGSTSEPGLNSWYWDFGNADTVAATNPNPQSRIFAHYGEVIVKHVVRSVNGCVSDTAQQKLTIFAKPSLSFQYPTSCLVDGVVQFKSTSSTPDGQTLKPDGYAWNFGDDQATTDNPNTSVQADPSHTFQYGTYDIKYSAATENGCVKDSLFTITINWQPRLRFPALSAVCQSLASSVSVAKAVVSNGVPGTSIYRGMATDAAGQFNPSVAGPGIHRIGFFYTSVGGCTDSVFQTITVYPTPNIEAGPSFVVPQGTQIQFKAQATDSLNLAYSWSPATALSSPTVLRPSLVALQDQKYTLTALSEHDCKATDFLTVTTLKSIKVPNAFSPNGDGMNDRWEIPNLAEYPGAVVQVFNRYGQPLFYSLGYAKPWEGNYNGRPLPVGTYYYVIDRKNGFESLTGSVTILK